MAILIEIFQVAFIVLLCLLLSKRKPSLAVRNK
jgi:hypothetical protein